MVEGHWFLSLSSILLIAVGGSTLLLAFVFIYKYLNPSQKEQSGTLAPTAVPIEEVPTNALGGPHEHPQRDQQSIERIRTVADSLAATRAGFWGRLSSLFKGGSTKWTAIRSDVEESLLLADLGPRSALLVMDRLDQRLRNSSVEGERLKSEVNMALREELLEILRATDEKRPSVPTSMGDDDGGKSAIGPDVPRELGLNLSSQKLAVLLVVGVNGAGKTTTIGKLAAACAARGFHVWVAAGDTFRAAAGKQLSMWAERASQNGRVEIFEAPGVTDPSAVAFQAYEKAQAHGAGLLIIDTAGRLHTSKELMEELRKLVRVLKKKDASAPHQTLLVVDANSGQNALHQAREFGSAVELSGVVLTKLDGSAKGGVAFGISSELGLPIRFVGLGEKLEDLRLFDRIEFVDAIAPAEGIQKSSSLEAVH